MAAIDVASSSDVRENASFAARVEGVRLLLTRVDGQVRAIEDKCPHLGLSMKRGRIEGAVVHCPWHGSTFDVCSGKNIDWIESVAGMKVPQWSKGMIAFGKQPTSVRTFAAREQDGRVLVEFPAG